MNLFIKNFQVYSTFLHLYVCRYGYGFVYFDVVNFQIGSGMCHFFARPLSGGQGDEGMRGQRDK